MKKVVITGVSRGIGLETAKKFLENNFQVLGISRSATKASIKDKNFFPLDSNLSKSENIKDLCKVIVSKGEVDILINNAGFGHFAALENISPEKIIEMINLNVTSHILMTKYLLPSLKKQSGHIFNISSRAGHHAYRFGTVYCASKFGLRGFSEALFDEVRNSKVRVSNISPGPVDTPFWDKLDREPEDRNGTAVDARDVAQVIFDTYSNKTAVLSEVMILPQFHAMRFKNESFFCKKKNYKT